MARWIHVTVSTSRAYPDCIPIPEGSQQGVRQRRQGDNEGGRETDTTTNGQSIALGGEKEEYGSPKDQEYAKENTVQ